MKKYVITVSEKFPASHSRKGEPTKFVENIKNGIKIHTIRTNYDFWKKRFLEIEKGLAELHIRTWSGKPYASKQLGQFVFGKGDGIGIQKLTNFIDKYETEYEIYNKKDFDKKLSKNHGLELKDFKEWFSKVQNGEELAIIHFTPFRYG